jgi:GAF domain-containing protein
MSEKKPERDVTADMERHGRDMQKVNDKLRDLISTLQSHKERHGQPTLTPPPTPPAPAEALEGGAVALDRKRLEAELALAREQLGRATAERALLRERLTELEQEHRQVCDEFVEAEEQAGQLVQLFATLQQLHGAADREALLQVVQEVVVNVVGSEELAIFEVQDGELRLARAFGVDPGPLQRVHLGQGPLGRAAQAGRTLVAGRDPDLGDDLLSACVPLTANGQLVGLVAVYRLLGHKPLLGPNDHQVFELLGPHAGQALRLRRAPGPQA